MSAVWLVKIITVLAVAYLAVVAAMYAMQTRMLFPASMVGATASALPRSATPIEVATPDGHTLQGLYLPSRRPADADRLLVLGFGGNAWNAGDVAAHLHKLFPEADVAAFHYRGYGPSTGAPSAAAILADTTVIFDHLQASAGARPIVAVGFSIGAGAAAHLAGQRLLAGLILVSPFDSLEALAREHYPWAPVKWLLRHQMFPAETLRRVTIPVTIIAAEHDTIVPPRRTEAVRRAIPNLVLDRTIADVGHNDIYDDPAFQAAMTEALDVVDRTRPDR